MPDPRHTLRRSCSLALPGGDRFVEATEWSNMEGVDVVIAGDSEDQRLELTWEQADALICVLAGVRVR